ncbi:transglycosylase SLT domain-containing protein [Streptomyces boncukensis]|uniref:Transglycosylase SLT domain-containing protein n=1 Tax=Streptomyces boncukensis TaxID=2711219 RepID=A0A6G4X0S3_9ACTN|nr:transglycosylase SLT domain-containing protein [Streptomyces boncukensis]NGO71149.1 transglycosylase SLT domain-containing protein [Streptomyces boncukensis]
MPSISGYLRNPRAKRITAAGLGAAGAAALAMTIVPGSADDGNSSQAAAKISTQPVAYAAQASGIDAKETSVARKAPAVAQQEAHEARKAKAAAEAAQAKQAKQAKAAKDAKAKAARDTRAEQEAARKAKAEAAQRDKQERKQPASRSAKRPAKPSYPNNLDGWIREALSIMKSKGIPGSYDGIKRNVIRESGGNPNAVNSWDVNARNGVPSKGLLQVIQPTFDAYHVAGTSKSLTDPVANIVAACNYAAHRYGSMDNVDSAY